MQRLVLPFLLIALLASITSAADVTRIDTSGPRPTFIVDGQPFFYHGVQISPHRLEAEQGWTWTQLRPLFAQAAADGFTVIPVPMPWNMLEGARGSWEWSRLDTAIDHAASQSIAMELLWFGASISATWSTLPAYASTRQLVVGANGVAVTDGAGHTKYDLSDPGLLSDETAALTTVMAHIASYIAAKGYPARTVVGVQVMNEPTVTVFENQAAPTDRSYSAAANAAWAAGTWNSATHFNATLLHRYLLGLARVVKSSPHVVWTRVNLCDAWEPAVHAQLVTLNEALRASAGSTPLDFIGLDPYTDQADGIATFCADTTRYHQGKNLVMVMENSGLYPNTDQLMFTCMAGNGTYAIWELNQSIAGWDCGLYSTDNANKSIAPRSHTQRVRDFNGMLAKDRRDLATLAAGSDSLAFINRGFAAVVDQRITVGSRSISYSGNGGGIAIARNDGALVFLATSAATIAVTLPAGITRLETGRFTAQDVWQADAQLTWSSNGSEHRFTVPAYGCVRLLPTTSGSGVGSGTGLTGTYFSNMQLANATTVSRTDTSIDFDWGTGSPASGIGADNFSVRWTGQVQAQFSETYTFTTLSDDGVRLWVNGQQLIDNWTDHAPIENSGTITLVAGQKYEVKMEFYENGYGAVAKLSWASPSTAKQIIPMSQLYPSGVTPVTPGALPAGWTAQDVGGVGLGGSTTQSNGTWTISGSGSDIWNNADSFRFASQRLTGDVQMTAQVTGLTNTDGWAKAGVMIRESLTAGSRHASTFATAASGLAFQRRLTSDGATSHTAGPGSPAPYWVRIERVGNVVISSTSPNGTTWTELRRETITMSAAVFVGLAVTSHNNGALCTATFTNVQVVGVAAAAN